MQAKYEQEHTDEFSYWFLLKCMAAVVATATITAGIIAAMASSKAALAASVFNAASTFSLSVLSFIPLAAIFIPALAIIGAAVMLPLIFCGDCSRASYRTTYPPVITVPVRYYSRGYYGGGSGFFDSWNRPTQVIVATSGGGHHHHGGGSHGYQPSSHQHGHQ